MSLNIHSLKPACAKSGPMTPSVLETTDDIVPASTSTTDIQNLYPPLDPELQAKFASQRLLASSSQDIVWEESQLNSFLKLQEKVNKKKKEFEELVISPDAYEEEKLDKERALQRMDRLLELPKQSKLLQSLPEVFNEYIDNLINNLLENNARLLNFNLASTPTESAAQIEAKVLHWAPVPQTKEELIQKLKDALPHWDDTGYLSYLLPGVPIIVKAMGLREEDKKRDDAKDIIQREDYLTDAEIEKLAEAGVLITSSNWQKAAPESLKITESVSMAYDAPFHGVTANRGHPILTLNHGRSALLFAGTVIHEDCHYITHDGQHFDEVYHHDYINEKQFPHLEHPWIRNGKRASLLNECVSYGMESKFYLHLLDWGGLNDEQIREAIEKLIEHKENAKNATRLLNQNPECLNETGKKWLGEVEKLWQEINENFQKQFDGYYISKLLGNTERHIRTVGYKALIHLHKNTAGENTAYFDRYCDEIKKDTCMLSLLNQASPLVNKDAPQEFRDVAKARLTQEEVLSELVSKITSLEPKETDKERWDDYFLILDAYLVCEDKRDLFLDSFKKYLGHEKHLPLLGRLTISKRVNPDFQEFARLAQERLDVVLDEHVHSDDWELKNSCYQHLTQALREDKDNPDKNIHLEKFSRFLKEEKGALFIQNLANELINENKDTPQEIKDLLLSRLQEENIQQLLDTGMQELMENKSTRRTGYVTLSETCKIFSSSSETEKKYLEEFAKHVLEEDDTELLQELARKDDLHEVCKIIIKQKLHID